LLPVPDSSAGSNTHHRIVRLSVSVVEGLERLFLLRRRRRRFLNELVDYLYDVSWICHHGDNYKRYNRELEWFEW
jgi:hypothetical protein